MTWLGAINIFVLQWFFIRFTRHTDKLITQFTLKEASILQSGNIGVGGSYKTEIYQWYSIQLWILPCTGWWNEFIYLNKYPKFIRCSKRKVLTN